jgi:hypothetical protein
MVGNDEDGENDAKAKGSAAGGKKKPKTPRTATTMYVEDELFKKWKRRLIDEENPGYLIVEEMMKGFLKMRPAVARALWKVPSNEKNRVYKAVEETLANELERLGISLSD